MKMFFLMTLGLLLISCKGGGGAFENLEIPTNDNQEVIGAVKIKDFTPTANPIIFTPSNQVTFAISIQDGAGAVNYRFILDDSTTLQNGTSPFLAVNGASLGLGDHTLKVIASNSISQDEKIFNLRKNNPPTVVSFTPALTGSLLNCSQDTLTMSAVTTDADGDAYTHRWLQNGVPVTGATPYVTVTGTSSSTQLAFAPDCAVAGFHQFSLEINDGYETTTTTWSISVINPAVETIISYFPTSNNITALSTENSKTFNASGSGVGTLTFTWRLDGAVVKTDSGIVSSNYILDTTSGTLSTGNHTLTVTLTDSTLSNDPPSPVVRSWLIYKNQKPTILSPNPSESKLMNLSAQLGLTANLQDALDTFTVTLTRGATNCHTTPSSCGLSGVNLPTTSGSFTAIFSPGTTYLGDNSFTLRVTDSYGEFETYTYNITANYFSDACNSLTAGRICTIAGLPGLGSGINVATESNRIRISPAWMTQDGEGNWFFSDHATNTVWYYNKKTTPVTLWANSTPSSTIVPAQSVYLVAGTGVAGSGGAGQPARRVPFNFGGWGGDLAWDSDRKELYISDYSNNRIIRIGQNGVGNTFCGAGSLNTQGSLAVNNECINPVSIEFDSTNRRLYTALYARHIIKYFDVSDSSTANWRGYIAVGTYNSGANVDNAIRLTGYPASTTNPTTPGQLNGPMGLKLDLDDNILYVAEYGSCRLRALGLPGATTQNIAGKNVTAGQLVTLAGNGCSSAPVGTNSLLTANLYNRPLGIEILKNSSAVRGIFVADRDGSRVSFLNNDASSVQLGNVSVASQRVNVVFGTGTSVGANPPTGANSVVVNPVGLFLEGGVLYVGSRGTSSIRTLNISTGNGAVTTYFGGTARASYSGNAALDSRLVTFNNPLSLVYKDSGNLLYASDSSNGMIRSINLTTGRVEDFIGTGTTNVDENISNTVTTATRIRAPRGMAIYKDHFLYADGGNNNCFIRAYNPLPSDQLIFNTLVNSNRTSSVAGFFNWCTNFAGTNWLDTTDPNARVANPYGIGVDSDNDAMYITSSSHCVLKVDDSGKMIPVIGTCGTAAGATTPNYGGDYIELNPTPPGPPIPDVTLLLNSPAELVMDPLYPENFFFVDFSGSALAHVKYVNISEASGVSFFSGAEFVGHKKVGTVLAATSSPGFIRALAAFEDWICYTSGNTGASQGNNAVVCRNRATGSQQVFGIPGAGGIQAENEQENVSAVSGGSNVTFAVPSGLAFDGEGNLYISEQGSHVIRKIKKWW
ncbi:MAG: hypothetical protein ACOVP4_04995 [Bacteriovoracaceae bacterium]